ncbi:hypothetical protein D3C79_616340 [compost metagenome]
MRRHLFVVQLPVHDINTDMRIDGAQLEASRFDLRHAKACIAMQDLALQIGEGDGVEINQRQVADARRGQVWRSSATQPAQADNQHSSGLQFFLAVEVKAAQDNLTVIAQRFGVG